GVPVEIYSSSRVSVTGCSRYIRGAHACPPMTDARVFIDWLRARLVTGAIDLVVPTSDLMLFYLTCVYDVLSPAMQAMLGPPGAIADVLFKDRFYQRCVALDFTTPRTLLPTSRDEALDLASSLTWPIVAKPRSHIAVGLARGQLARNIDELAAVFVPFEIRPDCAFVLGDHPALRWPMLQEYVPRALGNLFSVSGIIAPNGSVVAVSGARKIRQWPPALGVGTLFESSSEARPIDIALRIATGLQQRGIFEIELIYDEANARYTVIDVNPRAFGQIALDIARGNDLPWLWYRLACGETVPSRSAPADNMNWMHAIPYHVGALIGIARGPGRRAALGSYRDVLREQHVDIVNTIRDPLPSLAFAARMFRHPVGLVRAFWKG
ncbi:MAG: hypothetical protein H7Z43_09020, partial [Clostridia bacterium]|nr:hypothetical protein [Deltaproteobacteria bacterium]